MHCVIRDVIKNFDKRSDWSVVDTAGKELTRKQKKMIIKLRN